MKTIWFCKPCDKAVTNDGARPACPKCKRQMTALIATQVQLNERDRVRAEEPDPDTAWDERSGRIRR